jgi:hypothetical protein
VALTQELVPLIHSTNAPLTNRWFTDYLHQDLLGCFPADSDIQGLVVETCQQLPQSTSRLPVGM